MFDQMSEHRDPDKLKHKINHYNTQPGKYP
jgi:hypothetical protein